MTSILYAYEALFDLCVINILLALSQYVVLRAGVFSLGTAAFAAVGAYTAAILATTLQLSPWLGIGAAVVIGALVGAIVAVPLGRLRGVFQALATLALVQLVLSFTQNASDITNGALGINGIPKVADSAVLCVAAVIVFAVVGSAGRSGIGRAFDTIREDESVAAAFGISVPKYHNLAFILSGAIGGLAGALQAYNGYSIVPDEFGFNLVVNVLAMVVLGGRVSILGPLIGAIILTALPELMRAFASYRMMVQGALLMAVVILLPHGIADTAVRALRRNHFRVRQIRRKAHV
jgi:branched-chain amino acid transport system permease protein